MVLFAEERKKRYDKRKVILDRQKESIHRTKPWQEVCDEAAKRWREKFAA